MGRTKRKRTEQGKTRMKKKRKKEERDWQEEVDQVHPLIEKNGKMVPKRIRRYKTRKDRTGEKKKVKLYDEIVVNFSDLAQEDEEGGVQEFVAGTSEDPRERSKRRRKKKSVIWSMEESEEDRRNRIRMMQYELFESAEKFLSPKEMELFVSVYLYDEMQKEIAKQMGVSPSWVNQWLAKIYRKLAKNPELRKIPNIKEALTYLVGGERRFNKLFPDWPASDLQSASRKASTTQPRKLS